MTRYHAGSSKAWTGRVDGTSPRDVLRWHQVVSCIDLDQRVALSPFRVGIGFVGYAFDEGVARNLGRRGAAGGPRDIRRALSNLPVGFTEDLVLFDAGDVGIGGAAGTSSGEVEATQRALAEAVGRLRALGLTPFVLGGGHDLEFGHWLGVRDSLPADASLGVLSFDAHFDLRPHAGGANSGTSFAQIAETCRERGDALRYLCLGVQPASNTVSLFRTADELGVEYVLAREILDDTLDEVGARIDRFAASVDHLLITLDADVVSAAFAPGVSAPQPLGLHPKTVLALLERALATNKAVSFDVAEVSPRFDDDGRTAKLAALFVHAAVQALTPDDARIGPHPGE